MILEDLENFKQYLRHQEKKEKTIKQYSNYINDFIEATQIENKEDAAKKLSEILGIKVIKCSASKNIGIKELIKSLDEHPNVEKIIFKNRKESKKYLERLEMEK